ncbi:hypothetical protein [Phytomonospora endophytica]|uniref:Alanine-rich protein n=1 Tax=Phytomonospora endophytica TaxID=714109 RepID=A0A841FEA8_9ACTN|nr:hypothetical protein [Phytomonospora endophytica]MBB6034164.1 hypothetical protein [Phytomonospora endophytica]GIG66556.1 hypothetical protein Pen01_28510 [Phytomonospora endophytica]
MVTFSGHAYPWDVLGDPDFTARVAAHGIPAVTLAASYHSTRAATPLHPDHQIVDASFAALYRPVRESVWHGRRLRPRALQWMDAADPYGRAAEELHTAGLSVAAWIVLTHNTRLGTAFPELTVVNCFGERYPYALCPAQEEVRDYAATLAAEAIRDAPADAVSLEACGQLGVTHLSHHEKTDGAWTPEAARSLSVCCCAACAAAWSGRGLDPAEVTAALRAAVHGEAVGAPEPLDAAVEAQILGGRHASADRLRAQVLAAIREVTPDIPVTLHANPDPWATGPSPGITPAALSEVDALLVPAWPTIAATADAIADAARLGIPVDAYVTVLSPAAEDEVLPHVERLVAAGARRLSLYHLGLAPRWKQPLFAEVVAAFG